MFYFILYADDLLQFFKGLNITADQKKLFRKALHAYYEAAVELLQSDHAVSIYLMSELIFLLFLVTSRSLCMPNLAFLTSDVSIGVT